LGKKEIGYKREIGWLGSFAIGYGDVGPNIFIALGAITLFAGGSAPIAFGIAALLYAVVGLMYAELAPTYPYAGGVHVYAMKAFNSLVGFIAGWSMLLAYILCISLFSVAAAGYLRQLIPALMFTDINIAGLTIPSLGVLAGLLAAALVVLNIFGIKYSSLFILALVFLGLGIEGLILATGFALKFDPQLFLQQITVFGNNFIHKDVSYINLIPTDMNNFLYSITLAMASFVGIESIAQAAEETRRPHFSIPRAAKLIVAVVAFSAVAFPVLAVGSLPWQTIAAAYDSPMYVLVESFPYIGGFLTPVVGFAAFILCYASSNTGVIGVSRLTASMARFRLLPQWLSKIHPVFRTPVRTVSIFGVVGVLLSLLGDVPLLASAYAFAAVLSYVILFPTYIKLRRAGREEYSPWLVPTSIRIRGYEVPLIVAFGGAGLTAVFALMLVFHIYGRLVGLAWMLAGVALYAAYRTALGAGVLSKEEGKMIEPLSYRMKVGVLVRPYENMDTAYKSVTHQFDKRFDIRLVSIVEPARTSEEQLDKVEEEVRRELENLCRTLKSKHYTADCVVKVGDFEEEVSKMLDRGDFDLVAYIQRRAEKSALEKGHEVNIHNLITRYPGRVVSLRRVGE
jgi:APA family basic amino acid/polyamine antiporter